MGCNTSSQKVQIENYPQKSTDTPGNSVSPTNQGGAGGTTSTTGGTTTATTNKKSNINILSNVKKEDKLTESLENEAKQRRSVQGKTENMVREEFERDITLFYEINNGAILGEGISGSVKICKHRATGIEYALKTLEKTKLKSDALDNLRQEIRIMAQIDHPHIIRLHECFEDKKCIRLILELCTGGELLDRLHAQPAHKYNENVACGYIQTMLSAITYLHENGIVHRDLKLENFLFENSTPESHIKLIDFGLSQYFNENEIIVSPVGTPYYVAPEVLSGAYNNKCDVWSIGVITYMLLSGTPPFYGKDDLGTLRAVKDGKVHFDDKYFSTISNYAKHFIQLCLTKNVSQRPTAKSLLQHEWFKQQNIGNSDASPSLNVLTRLVLFNKKSELTKLCMEVVAHTLTSQQIELLRTQFKLLDKNNTGEILYSDLKNVLQRQSSISTANMEIMFGTNNSNNSIDIDQTKIKYHEFLAATLSRQNITENNMRVAFEKLSNHHDFITVEDIKDLLGKDGSEEEIRKMLIEVNLDPDNTKISYDNFKTIMHGGDQSPVVNSPYNKYRKQISYGSPSTGGSKKTPGTKSANKKDSLARKAVTNRAMSHSEADSPVRPEVLNFQEEKSESQTKKQDNEIITTPPSADDHVLPPPSTPPPPLDPPRQKEDW